MSSLIGKKYLVLNGFYEDQELFCGRQGQDRLKTFPELMTADIVHVPSVYDFLGLNNHILDTLEVYAGESVTFQKFYVSSLKEMLDGIPKGMSVRDALVELLNFKRIESDSCWDILEEDEEDDHVLSWGVTLSKYECAKTALALILNERDLLDGRYDCIAIERDY